MLKNMKSPDNTGKKQVKRNKKGQFVPGFSGNYKGRPEGSENFRTKWENFLKEIAKQNELKPEDVEEQLLMIGFNRAKAGDFQFWKDIHDRIYGKPILSIDHSKGLNIQEQRVPTKAERAAARAYYEELEKHQEKSS
jgi:uncharacterized protein YdbL (DUF1318 family)